MNREEILAKSRSENNTEFEKETYKYAGSIARIIGGLLCGLLLVVEQFATGHLNCGYFLIYCVMQATHDGYIFIRTKSKLHLFSFVCYIAISIIMGYGFIKEMAGR